MYTTLDNPLKGDCNNRCTELLEFTATDPSVVAPSLFSRTGWVRQKLTLKEQAAILEAPRWAIKLQHPPSSLTTRVVDALLINMGQMQSRQGALSPSPPESQKPKGNDDDDGDWIQSIQGRLSSAWADPTLISEKAVKADDAEVPTHHVAHTTSSNWM